jgi:hypothetical protein
MYETWLDGQDTLLIRDLQNAVYRPTSIFLADCHDGLDAGGAIRTGAASGRENADAG